MIREISAGIVIYRKTKEGPKFLLLYHGGRYWNFPKGHIETLPAASDKEGEVATRETSLAAAVRETAEETGLLREDLKIESEFKAYEKYTFYKGRNRIFKIVIFYLAETKERQIRISDEHEGFGWFLYKDAKRLFQPYKDGEAILKKAVDFIKENP